MDISAANWNEDDNANTAAAPDGAAEGMAPSGVNNVLRAHQGALKRFYNWTSPKITSGSGTAYTLSYAVAPGSLVDGMTHLVQFNAANGNASTLNVNSLGATPIQYYSAGAWRAVPAALWDADVILRVAYNAAAGAYRILNRPDTTGDWVPTGRSTARAGTILAQGQAASRTGYAGLFAAYGTAYGIGDGSTTFNLPNLQGRVVAGAGGSYVLGAALGSDTNVASTISSVSGNTFGSISVNIGGPFADAAGSSGNNFVLNTSGLTTSGQLGVTGTASGTSGAFSVVQPTRVGNYLICL